MRALLLIFLRPLSRTIPYQMQEAGWCLVAVAGAFLLSMQVAQAQSNPVPFVSSPLVPTAVAPGGPGFTISVNGTGFVPGSVVNWNGAELATTFESQSRISAEVAATNITTAGTAFITVTNPLPGGGTSNELYFEISSPVAPVFFTQLPPSVVVQGSAFPIEVDLNSDGMLDLAYSNNPYPQTGGITVQLGNGDGTYQPPLLSSIETHPFETLSRDFNGDGKLDVAVLNNNYPESSNVSVLLGNGDGTFQYQTFFDLGKDYNYGIVASDFNRDGRIDLVVGSNDPTGGFSILLGNGDGTFQTPMLYGGSEQWWGGWMVVGDFNGDRKLDLIQVNNVQNIDFGVTFYKGNGDGTFQPRVHYSWPQVAGVAAVAAVDLNGDNKLDLLVTDLSPGNGYGGGGLWFFLGNGNGTFQSPIEYAAGRTIFDLQVQDFNADGTLDVVLLNSTRDGYNHTTLLFLPGNGDGTFQNAIEFPSDRTFEILSGDFNGDGRIDVGGVSSNDGFTTVSLLLFLQGKFPLASTSPASLTFSQQAVGTSSPPQIVKLTNTGTAALTVSEIGITGAYADESEKPTTARLF